MITSLPSERLKKYVSQQLDNFFPDDYAFSGGDVDSALTLALDRVEWCFKHIAMEAYFCDGQSRFSHLHSDQYSQFLYFLSNSLWGLSENKPLCDKIITLNKALNGMFFSYKGKLPSIFLFGHPVGTIIGNADYSDFLVILQNVTINTDKDESGGPAPHIGRGAFFAAGAMVLGNKRVGDRCSIGANTVVFNKEIPDDSVVFSREDGSLGISQRKKSCKAQDYFNVTI
jgi:serine O-acetyltransferase